MRRIRAIGLVLPLCGLVACGGTHQASQPAPTVEPTVLDQRMKEMQAELEQMRQQQQQMQQQQEQQRQQQLQLMYQQRQAAAAAGTAPANAQPGAAPLSPQPGGMPGAGHALFPAFDWYDPSAPRDKPDVKNLDQKL